tara:strand:+ start:499 stop:750 length:252 start_codon:yes stop_codon:yes gene_type:complete
MALSKTKFEAGNLVKVQGIPQWGVYEGMLGFVVRRSAEAGATPTDVYYVAFPNERRRGDHRAPCYHIPEEFLKPATNATVSIL